MLATSKRGRQMLPVVYYSMCLHKRDDEWARDLHSGAQEFSTVISPQIRKNVILEPMDKEGLLYI